MNIVSYEQILMVELTRKKVHEVDFVNDEHQKPHDSRSLERTSHKLERSLKH